MRQDFEFRKGLKFKFIPLPGRGVDIGPRWLKFEFKPLNQAAATSRGDRGGI